MLLEVNRRRGTTLVLVTHDPELAARADMTIRLRDGRIESIDGGPGATPGAEAP